MSAADSVVSLSTVSVTVFACAKSAAKAAAKFAVYPQQGEDGNCYPRVLKVRLSWIVEGVAFESVVRDIEGGAKLEGVE